MLTQPLEWWTPLTKARTTMNTSSLNPRILLVFTKTRARTAKKRRLGNQM